MEATSENPAYYKLTSIGTMSGTSLDGLDLAYCEFLLAKDSNKLQKFSILTATTIPYPKDISMKLANIEKASALEFCLFDREYGRFIGTSIRNLLQEQHLPAPTFVSSHGHTIFHQPALKLTVQIGHPCSIAAESGLPVIGDFRTLDVALGGQGAPLVPIGDHLLFADYDYCLNLGGIANISFAKTERIAFDVCPFNMMLNYYAGKKEFSMDEDGKLAEKGHPSLEAIKAMKELEYFKKEGAKSLGKEYIFEKCIPIIEKHNLPVEDSLATICELAADEIAQVVIKSWEKKDKKCKMLITGGGAFNK